jgi:hypothetical protein
MRVLIEISDGPKRDDTGKWTVAVREIEAEPNGFQDDPAASLAVSFGTLLILAATILGTKFGKPLIDFMLRCRKQIKEETGEDALPRNPHHH